MASKVIVRNIVNEKDLLDSLPARFVLKEGVREAIVNLRERVCSIMESYVENAIEPRLLLTQFNKSGSQWIADFSISDKAKPEKNQYNWHLQNTSQWLFAGCILFDERDGRVSIHT